MSFTTAQMRGFSRKGERNAGDCSWGAAPGRRTWDREDNEIFHAGISGRACKGRACRACRNTGELPGQIKNCSVELYAEGTDRAIYSGIVQRAESQEENGYCLLRLELGSGSLLMDMGKEKRTDGGYLIQGTASNGLDFCGYLRNEKITNFFPSVPE